MNRLFLYAAAAAFLVTGCKAQAPSNAASANQASAAAAPAAPAAPATPALSPNPNCASGYGDPDAAARVRPASTWR